jgi:hypothetical protein
MLGAIVRFLVVVGLGKLSDSAVAPQGDNSRYRAKPVTGCDECCKAR